MLGDTQAACWAQILEFTIASAAHFINPLSARLSAQLVSRYSWPPRFAFLVQYFAFLTPTFHLPEGSLESDYMSVAFQSLANARL